MHELSIAQAILESTRTALTSYPGAHVERIRVAVGELSAIEPDLLQFAWEALLEGTPEAGCVLDIEWRPAKQVCLACGLEQERPRHGWLGVCAACGGALRLEGGRELDLLQVTFSVPEEAEE